MIESEIISQLSKDLGVELKELDPEFPYGKGYILDEKGNIVYLSLTNCGIKSLENKIQYLKDITQLVELDLSYNDLSEIRLLDELPQLVYLNLAQNRMLSITPLKRLNRLVELNLNGTRCFSLEPIANLPELTHLSLADNAISIIEPLIAMGKLIELDLSNNFGLTNITPLQTLNNLKRLNLNRTHCIDISPIKGLVNLIHLNLSDNAILDVSPLANLHQLAELDLSSNEVNDIKPLKNLMELQVLDLSNNKIDEISAIKSLTNITYLGLFGNKITNITALKDFNKLEVVFLGNNNLDSITILRSLKNLKELYLGTIYRWTNKSMGYFENIDNKLSDISILEGLEHLTALDLSGNAVVDIQPLKNFTNLERLYLSKNLISTISSLENLKRLKYLKLDNNQIKELPAWILDLDAPISYKKDSFFDESISLYKNPFAKPPLAVIRQGRKGIKDYYKQLKDEGKIDYLFEAKLLVIGEGGTGKTTFIRKMQDANAEMPADKDTTFGIDIGKWSYKIEFPKMPQLGKVNFNVNLWDFGGQKVYQGTHQIFFTDKSFYVLIGDTREQKTDFSYWLNTVAQLGSENSSLMIILNKKFGHEQKFDESGYRSYFGSLIKDIVELDLKDDQASIYELQDKVKIQLRQLAGIGDALPPSWVAIRQDLRKEKRNFISFDEFRKICGKHKIKEAGMISTLSGYFNRIGVFTHYINDPVLQERVYLNSNWLVKTVYKVLDDETVAQKKGKLSETDIKKIWNNNELFYEISKLVQLMHNFGLMYRIPESDNYVVPAHLPTVTPYAKWEHANESLLQFVYEFNKYMPQGIMSRLIVSLNHHIKNHDLVWHRGVNIETSGAQAEILESYGGSNRFEIKIAGKNKIELLGIIREHFSEVLKPFNNLNYKQLIPCICDECKKSAEPGFHEYDRLIKFREKGTGSQCPKTGQIISAEELLKIIELKPVPKSDNITTAKNNDAKIVKIFLASSSELELERKEFREFISVENDRLINDGVYLKIEQWEYFIDAMSKETLQAEYNKAIKNCDIFLSLFFTKVGKYTAEEFETAFGEFKETGKPLVYTYFKKAAIDLDDVPQEDYESRKIFLDKLKKLGHFRTIYTDSNDLQNKFKRQLEMIRLNL